MMLRDGEETGRRVVAFARPDRVVTRDRVRLPDETGHVLLFTGVRYERLVEAPPPEGYRSPDPKPGDARLGG